MGWGGSRFRSRVVNDVTVTPTNDLERNHSAVLRGKASGCTCRQESLQKESNHLLKRNSTARKHMLLPKRTRTNERAREHAREIGLMAATPKSDDN